ncbi:MAG: DUF2203 domain-containing protein [Candidatus Palauibacterales bacterium]|nr:DUF2203 domain-containing protein [Candidatus Palauibacterales bacterium]
MTPRSDIRFFTVQEANATLPFVSRIMADIVEENARLQELLPALKEARMRTRRRPSAAEELDALRADVAAISARLEGYLKELSQVGCVFKGPQGLVDFYSMREGRPIFLCWRYGEEEIRYWHELEGGFAGRLELEPEAVASP